MSASNRIPIDEGSFLDVKNPDLMQRIATDMMVGWHAKAMLRKQQFARQAQAAARIEHIAREWCTEDFIETDPASYYYWVGREGHHFFSDARNRKRYLEENPQCRRKVVTGRTVITANTPWPTKHAVRTALQVAAAA